jgi:hypothetical protein
MEQDAHLLHPKIRSYLEANRPLAGLNAFDYMVLGRMIHLFIPTHSVMGIRASWLSVVFVLLDIGSFVIQLYGVTMTNLSSPPATILKGTHIYMGGIGLQQFFIIVFLGLAIRFYFNMLRLERNNALPIEKQNWRRLLYTLYASLFFITVCTPSCSHSHSQLHTLSSTSHPDTNEPRLL